MAPYIGNILAWYISGTTVCTKANKLMPRAIHEQDLLEGGRPMTDDDVSIARNIFIVSYHRDLYMHNRLSAPGTRMQRTEAKGVYNFVE
jgi:hypothetical protein